MCVVHNECVVEHQPDHTNRKLHDRIPEQRIPLPLGASSDQRANANSAEKRSENRARPARCAESADEERRLRSSPDRFVDESGGAGEDENQSEENEH